MSGPIVPNSRQNGLGSAAGYPLSGGLLNQQSDLLNQNNQRTNQIPQQTQLNGTRNAMTQRLPRNMANPSPTRPGGYSPENFQPMNRSNLLGTTGIPPLELENWNNQWDNPQKNLTSTQRFSLENRSDFPALGQRGVSDYSVRPTPSSPSTAPSRPQSLSDGPGLRQNIDSSHLGSPSPLSSLNSLRNLQMNVLNHGLGTSDLGGGGPIPGLSLSSSAQSRNNYLSSLNNKNGTDQNIQEFSMQDADFPALDNVGSKINQNDDDSNTRDFADSSVLSSFDSTIRQQQLLSDLSGIQSRPSKVGQIKYESMTHKLHSIPSSMLTDKYSFIGCLHVLEQIFEAKTAQPTTNNTESSASSTSGNSNGVTPPPGVVPLNGPTQGPPGVSPPASTGQSSGSNTATSNQSTGQLSPSAGGQVPPIKRNLFQGHSLDKDLTKMGLSFIKDNRLIYRFQSPFADMPCRVQDIDMFVPGEYLTNIHIREKLAEIKPSKYNEDLLFWMFYSNPNDYMQLTAAEELFQRNWRFHKEKKIWISKTQNIKARVENHNYEEGTFHVWDVDSWKKVAKDMKVEYAKLEDKSPLHGVPRSL